MKVYSVSEFREEINELLGQVTVMVQGEVSDFHISQNRFVWFSLVDEDSAVSCFMMTFQLRQQLEDGMEIRAVGTPTLFKKGQFAFKPRQIELVGEGSLQKAFALLKKKLEKEGLFDESRKRQLPRFPQKVGLVTSKDAAAYTDVLRILKNRWAGLDIRHMHVQVQGVSAVDSIVDALHEMNETQKDLDCIILTRGGGSLEDLQAFNSEEVVRAIFASDIPVVCAVGHERDVTLSDMAADVRASTPSNAAELVVPEKRDVIAEIQYMTERMGSSVDSLLDQYRDRIYSAVQLLDHNAREQVGRFEELQQRLNITLLGLSHDVQMKLSQVQSMMQLLKSINPMNVLQRGYTMTLDEMGRALTSAARVRAGQRLRTRFFDGEVRSTADKK
ncbi:MAG: exodeoxyribonuclease VII large subunit [Candidatus Kerfeldbacteria bacterium]